MLVDEVGRGVGYLVFLMGLLAGEVRATRFEGRGRDGDEGISNAGNSEGGALR